MVPSSRVSHAHVSVQRAEASRLERGGGWKTEIPFIKGSPAYCKIEVHYVLGEVVGGLGGNKAKGFTHLLYVGFKAEASP